MTTSLDGESISAAQLVKNGNTICILVEGVEPYQFDSKNYAWDLKILTDWYRELTGSETGLIIDKLHHDLQALWYIEPLAQTVEDKRPRDEDEALEKLTQTFRFKTLQDTEEILVYNGGVYEPTGETRIKEWMEKYVGSCSVRTVHETINHIKWQTYCRRDEFDNVPETLNLANGLYDLNFSEFGPSSPSFLSMVKLPVTYDPNAHCPSIEKFLSEVLYPEDVRLVQEFVGYCLWRGYPAAKALLLLGDGENGKSTFINLLKALLGTRNISSRGLQELETDRFAKADLYTKFANLYADLPDVALKSTGIFKMLTGGDNLTAEHKFQRSFNFTNYAKLVFSANRAPETMEDTNAFWRRWLIVTFPNSFNGSNADRELLAKLTTRDELSGFLNWAIEGLKRLRRNGWNFSNSKSTSMIREEYIRKSSPFKAFMTDCTEIVADGFVIKADLYDCYCVYCRERQLPIQSKETFFSKLPQLGQFQTGQHTIAGNRRWGLIGLALRKEDDWGKRTEEEERGAETSKPRSQDMVEQEKQGLGSAQAAQGASYLSPSTQGTCEYCNLFGEVALDYDRRYACAACAMEVKGS